MSNVVMPQFGESVAEGKIIAWFKQVGDEITSGDDLFSVETDKVTMEVQAIVSGPLSEIRVPAGTVAKVGATVATIGAMPVKSVGAIPAKSERPVYEEVTTSPGRFGPAKSADGLSFTPLARRLIAQNDLDPALVASAVASKGGTRIAARDVNEALASKEAPVAVAAQPQKSNPVLSSTKNPVEPAPVAGPPVQNAPTGRDGQTVALNTIRKRTGERLAINWATVPHVYQAIEVDFTKVESARSQFKQDIKARTGSALTYLPFIARAVCIASRAFPFINARINGDSLVLSPDVNLGIAVDLSHEGLVVPVIRNADEMNVPGLVCAIGAKVDSARNGRLSPADFDGGTYTISNNGAFGSTFTVPIINVPQVAILSVDAIRQKPAIVETAQGAFVAPRLMGMIGQSFDHRAFDGAYSGAFLSRVKDVIEERDWASEFQ